MLGSPGTCRQCFCTRRLPSQLLLPAVTTGPLALFPGGEAFLGTRHVPACPRAPGCTSAKETEASEPPPAEREQG